MSQITEIWKPIKGWEDYYEISNLGRVRSKTRTIPYKGHYQRTIKSRILKGRPTKGGYWQVCLQREGKRQWLYIHRLIGMHFCSRPPGTNVVRHKDDTPGNCHAENLLWGTQKDNVHDAIKQGHRVGIAVENSDGVYHDLMCMVAEDGYDPTCVSRCLHGKQRTHKGKTWHRASDYGDGIHGILPMPDSRFGPKHY